MPVLCQNPRALLSKLFSPQFLSVSGSLPALILNVCCCKTARLLHCIAIICLFFLSACARASSLLLSLLSPYFSSCRSSSSLSCCTVFLTSHPASPPHSFFASYPSLAFLILFASSFIARSSVRRERYSTRVRWNKKKECKKHLVANPS